VTDIYITKLQIDSVKNAISITDAENVVMGDAVTGELATAPSSVSSEKSGN